MADASNLTFEFDELPGVLFTATRGSQGEPGLPSNWITIVGTRRETPDPTADIPDPEPVTVEVCRVGFAGP